MNPTLAYYITASQDGSALELVQVQWLCLPVNMALTGHSQEILEDNPSWGITTEVKADKSKMNTILSRIRNRLTHRRSEIKKVVRPYLRSVNSGNLLCILQIMNSLGEKDLEAIPDSSGCKLRLNARNIFELCDDIQAIFKRARLPRTVELCGRVAVLV